MKIIIAGSRSFDDYDLLQSSCDRIIKEANIDSEIVIVSGTAKGADRLGERYAVDRGYDIKKFPADWDMYGKAAGYKRNAVMARYADMLIAFWDGNSKGTQHMITLAKEHNLRIAIITMTR